MTETGGCALSSGFIRWGACLSSAAADSYGPDPQGRRGFWTGGEGRELREGPPPFKAVEELSVYAALCRPPSSPLLKLIRLERSSARVRSGRG